MLTQVNIFIVVFLLLLIGVGISTLLIIAPQVVRELGVAMDESSNSKASGLSLIMQKLSTETNMNKIEELLEKIKKELQQSENSKGVAQQNQTQTIQKWLKEFSPKLHIEDIKKTGTSQQVQFDNKTKNFKLMIVK